MKDDDRFCGGCGLPQLGDTVSSPQQPPMNAWGQPMHGYPYGQQMQPTPPQPIQANGMYPAPPVGPTNNMAWWGFILSFLIPIVGLILSIIGLRNAPRFNGNGRGIAIAGIVISILMFIANFYMLSSGMLSLFYV